MNANTLNLATLLSVTEMLTGLTIDDFINETTGTEEEQFQAKLDNVAKMADHMKLGKQND